MYNDEKNTNNLKQTINQIENERKFINISNYIKNNLIKLDGHNKLYVELISSLENIQRYTLKLANSCDLSEKVRFRIGDVDFKENFLGSSSENYRLYNVLKTFSYKNDNAIGSYDSSEIILCYLYNEGVRCSSLLDLNLLMLALKERNYFSYINLDDDTFFIQPKVYGLGDFESVFTNKVK